MKAETKTAIKNATIVLVVMAVFAGCVTLFPAKATLAVILFMQLITIIAVGGTNLRINDGQKKQDT